MAEGRGAKEPIADNATREGRTANRRIEILLVKTDTASEPAPATGGN